MIQRRSIVVAFLVALIVCVLVVVGSPNVYAASDLQSTGGFAQRLQNILTRFVHSVYIVDESDVLDDSTVTIHRINMGASNAYLLESEAGMVLVDAGLPFSEQLVLRQMEQIGREDLRLIFITHAHIDHFGAANALREATGAPVAIHRADAEAMALGHTELGTVRDWEQLSETALPYVEPLLNVTPTQADILLDDGDSLSDYGLDATILHTPGHTPGSATLMVDGNRFAFVGDLVSTSGGKPHAQSSFAEDWTLVDESISRLKDLAPELVYAGHGNGPISGDLLDTLRAYYLGDE